MGHCCFIVLTLIVVGISACGSRIETNKTAETPVAAISSTATQQRTSSPTPAIPNLQAELTDDRNKTTNSPIDSFDFKNYTYELPRGWQNPDGSTEITLINGRLNPIEGRVSDDMSDDAKAEEKSRRRIGMSFVTTKYLDVTDDGEDEAIVILRVETGGGAIPQIVHIFAWKDGEPELIWPFRTGDRADGGLKDIRSENGLVVVELFGQDRFLLGQIETGKITDDIEQLCCPTFFTRSSYKWNGKNFLMQGKRLTYSMTNRNAPPIENMGDKVNAAAAAKPKK